MPLESITAEEIIIPAERTVNSVITKIPANATWSNVSDLNWTSSNLSIATISDLGEITGVSEGIVTITVSHKSQNTSCSYTVNVTLKEGVYFINNRETHYFLQPDNNGSSHMEQHEFDATDVQLWQLIYISEGYYHVRNISSNLFLTSPESNNDAQAIIQQQYNLDISSRQLWKFTHVNKCYSIKSKSKEQTNLVLGVGVGIGSGVNVEQRIDATQSSLNCQWNIYDVSGFINEINHWNSDGDCVGFWQTAPTIYFENKCPSPNFHFSTSFDYAKAEWEEVLGCVFPIVTNKDDADILCYGLTASQYEELTNSSWDPSHVGLTGYSCDLIGYVVYNNEVKYIYSQQYACVYILYDPENICDVNSTKNTMMHELGHALGYFDHSPFDSDLMSYDGSTTNLLSSREETHILQIYELMA